MADCYRFKITHNGADKNYSAYCRKTRETLTSDTEHKLWNKIKSEYNVNKHYCRKKVWIAVYKDPSEDVANKS